MRRATAAWIRLGAMMCLLAFAALPAAAGYEDIENEVQEIVLDNGLKILLLERHEVPVFSFWTYVNVGGVDEATGLTGLAHMFEHMAFKGSTELGSTNYKKEKKLLDKMDLVYEELRAERWKGDKADPDRIAELETEFEELQDDAGELVVPNAFGRMVEENGGVGMNAMTSADATQYFYSMPSNQLELWALVESDRFVRPVLREFYKERNVIIEERRMRTESQPQGRLFEEFIAAAFLGHSYGQPTIGHRSDIEAYSRLDAYEFYEEHYGAKNMVVAVVGDVYYDDLKKVAKKYFGKIPPGHGEQPIRTIEPEQRGERRVTLVDSAQPFMFIGYHIPATSHADTPALEALADILGQGRSSRLSTSLIKDTQQALWAGSFTGFPGERFPNLLALVGLPNQGIDPIELEEAIYGEIDKILEDGITDEELAGYKQRARAQFIQGLEGNTGMAAQLCWAEMILGDWRRLFTRLDEIGAITADEVQRVAQEYLVEKHRTVAMIVTEQDS